MMQKKQKAVFLDRDGTMNVEVNYLHRPEDLVLIDGTAEAVRMLNEAGYRVIVVTNQAGVARGYYKEEDVVRLHSYLNELLGRQGAHVDAFYYCPHHPEHGIGEYKKRCHCRKPETGMFEQAERDTPGGIDKEQSYMIGDKLLDTRAGRNYGVTGILVGTGYGSKIREEEAGAERSGTAVPKEYDFYAENLLEAVRGIVNGTYGRKRGTTFLKEEK
ncbi:MAG: D-glycero-alpha-D-manno-heptose-1,7-bisphosphate 7-phosphatase [Otoolea sp.]|nr:HAD family hydrolase [Clostridiaceae bacterium]MDD6073214.1 HAD family hydrolase [Clostridium sp.]MDY5484719.1 HAD family hydrolase [Clostridium sp.]